MILFFIVLPTLCSKEGNAFFIGSYLEHSFVIVFGRIKIIQSSSMVDQKILMTVWNFLIGKVV